MNLDEHKGFRSLEAARKLGGFLVAVAAVLVLSLFLRSFLLEGVRVPTGSMEGTIEVGDMVLVEKVSYRLSDPEPGDIVTFPDPELPERTLIKRCIASEGQTVDLVDGRVVVDGVFLDEPYVQGKPSEPLSGSDIGYPYTVPKGCIWAMGDNRVNSADSRAFGPIPVSSVAGRAFFTYWPLGSLGFFEGR